MSTEREEHVLVGTQKDIDNRINTPQYLGPDILPMLEVGHSRDQGPQFCNPLQGENVHGGNMPAKKKAAKKKKKH
jgi:hypothetical protein